MGNSEPEDTFLVPVFPPDGPGMVRVDAVEYVLDLGPLKPSAANPADLLDGVGRETDDEEDVEAVYHAFSPVSARESSLMALAYAIARSPVYRIALISLYDIALGHCPVAAVGVDGAGEVLVALLNPARRENAEAFLRISSACEGAWAGVVVAKVLNDSMDARGTGEVNFRGAGSGTLTILDGELEARETVEGVWDMSAGASRELSEPKISLSACSEDASVSLVSDVSREMSDSCDSRGSTRPIASIAPPSMSVRSLIVVEMETRVSRDGERGGRTGSRVLFAVGVNSVSGYTVTTLWPSGVCTRDGEE